MHNEENTEEYIASHSTPEDPVLNDLYRETNLKVVYPRMVSGHIQGKFLEMMSYMIRPLRILEIGTYTGYSAICLAKGLKENGVLHTIEINDELKNMELKYFQQSGLQDHIVLHTGDALDVIPTLEETFGLVFIDGDKQQYLEYYQLVFPKVLPGGFIFADNVLWGGKVMNDTGRTDKETTGIIEFNEFLKQDERVEQVMLPIGDGFTLIRKLNF